MKSFKFKVNAVKIIRLGRCPKGILLEEMIPDHLISASCNTNLHRNSFSWDYLILDKEYAADTRASLEDNWSSFPEDILWWNEAGMHTDVEGCTFCHDIFLRPDMSQSVPWVCK